jgi:hypothetical protein
VRSHAALVLAVVLAAAPASAQDCVEGRVLVSERCCWPGQTFDETARACTGAPSCPEDLVAEGETCVPSLALLARRAITQADVVIPEVSRESAAAALGSPSFASVWPIPTTDVTDADAPNPHWERSGWDDGLIAAGLALWAASYIVAIIPIPLIFSSGHRSASFAPNWPAAFIPLMPYLTQIESSSPAWVFSLPSALGQGAGFGLILAGVLAHIDEVHFGGTATLRVRGVARGADLGGGLELAF